MSFINIDITNIISGDCIIDEFLASTRIDIKSLYYCGDIGTCAIKCYGISQNPITKEYMLVMDYAKGGNLNNYLQKHFINITWTEKIKILVGISYGPTIDEVWDFAIKWCQLVDEWIYSGIPLNDPKDSADLDETIKQAEKKRLELIRSEKLGPKYTEKSHPKAVFTSSALSSFISSSRISFNLKQEYITKEYELDINDIQSSSTQNINSDTQNSFNSQHQNVHISRPLRPLSKLITTVTANSSSKRNIKELNIETPNNRKHIIKPNNSD
ncbi:kinase-like domain-containing protein [Rhizophagus irregularis DAOM 181602=DAOM 197198]|nr:kinase-like domain-containing protein [Rhizophagus irregularis DAOM 181602=DAOM 197198]